MNDNIKNALVVFGGGILLFWLFKDSSWVKGKKKKEKIEAVEIDPKELQNKRKANAFIGLKAYIDALNNRENEKVLDELNRQFAKELKIRVYKRSKDGVVVASDLNGKVILENK